MEITALISLYFKSLVPLAIMALAGWLLSLKLKKVSFIDSMWSIFIATSGVFYVYSTHMWQKPTVMVASCLLVIWAVRLSGHITMRNWGKGEDHRYAAIGTNLLNTQAFILCLAYKLF